tara:strand:- start:1258 stop:1971 length:714 start_codon:yes stop_codon:yes gene_type:complete
MKNEKFYDFTGMIAYLSIIIFAIQQKYIQIHSIDIYSLVLCLLISIWTLRLGIFLFYRVLKVGEDIRFKDVKNNALKFFVWFSISSLWVSLTTIAAMNVVTSKNYNKDLTLLCIGTIIWIIGFLFEIISDYQKIKFKNNALNKNKFIDSGLWSISRHPNYFGEIILWIGIYIITLPSTSGLEYLGIISPLFVIVLLNKVSGINLLEASADKKWGSSKEYQKYKKITPKLIPRLWKIK